MIRLISSELRRLRSRTLFRGMLIAVLALMVFVCMIVFLRAKDVSYPTALDDGLLASSQLLFTLSVVVGASFVGAEWSSGSMSTLLTWEPRRARVLVAKFVACVVTTVLVTLALLVILALLLLPSAAAHGTTAGVDWWRAAGIWLRVGAVVGIGGALGVGLATVMRTAAGPVATWLIFQFVASPILILWKRWLIRWLPDGIIRQFLGLETVSRGRLSGGTPFVLGANYLRGGLLLSAYAVAFAAAGYASFRARDVT